jgi:hypothetical protein
MKLIIVFAALLVFLAACTVMPPNLQPKPLPPAHIACTEDAKICPDGSAVGRIPPGCEFAPCPDNGKEYCEVDTDCVCGGIDTQTENCFVGSKKYYYLFVNREQDCPDFCTGIDGRMQTRCVKNKCVLVRGEPPEVGPSIEIIAEPATGEAPLLTKLTAVLRGFSGREQEFYCVEMNWQFGDGTVQASTPSCIPYDPSLEVQTRYTAEHRYEKPGAYEVTFTLGTLKSKPATVFAAPEFLPPECDEDSDCVPAQCCHAADCIIKEKRSDCSKVACTMECRPGTLDCGGSCGCINGRCTGQNFQPGTDTFSGPRPWQVLS